MFALIGGFVGMITKLTGFALRGYQNFTIDKSMIKKLYTKKDSKSKSKIYYRDAAETGTYNLDYK